MATVDAMAMAADRKAIVESGPMAQLAGAKSRATAVGKQAWKTIAPEMLPMASVSLPCRTQRMLLSFSGSSVAIGAMTRASNVALTPEAVRDGRDCVDEDDGAADDEPQGEDDLQGHHAQSWDDRIGSMRSAIQTVEAQRGEVAAVPGLRFGREMGPDVDAVQDEEDDRGGRAGPGPLERREGDGDGQAVGHQEVAHVLADDVGLDVHAVASPPTGPVGKDGATGHEHGQGCEHERCAQDGPDADLIAGSAAARQDRDKRDHRLRQGRADGGQHRADRALGQVELAADPFDAVREQLGAQKDDRERDEEEDDRLHGQCVPIATTSATASATSTKAAVFAPRRSPARAKPMPAASTVRAGRMVVRPMPSQMNASGSQTQQ